METHSTYPYQKNLEQIEEEIQAGYWRIAAFIDRISEKKFLRFRFKHPDGALRYHGMFDFRGKSATAISPLNCPRILYTATSDEGTELLTPYIHLLQKHQFELPSLQPTLKTLLHVLARFEKYDFYATNLSPISIGVGAVGEVYLLPNAYVLPPGWRDNVSAINTGPGSPRQPSRPEPFQQVFHPALHLEALAEFIESLGTRDAGTPDSTTPETDRFRQVLSDAAASSKSGDIPTLADLNDRLFGEPLPRSLHPFPGHRAGAPLSPEAEGVVRTIHTAAQERRVIVLKGDAFTGKSTILDKTTEHFNRTAGDKWQIIRPDEWNLFSKNKKSNLPKGSPSRKILWIVDDIVDRPYVYGYFSRWLMDEKAGVNSVLLLALDPQRA